jgi:hypothetical protein
MTTVAPVKPRYAYSVTDQWDDKPHLYRALVVSTHGANRVKLKHDNESGSGWGFRTLVLADSIHYSPAAALKAYRAACRRSVRQSQYDIKRTTRMMTMTPVKTFVD